MSTEPKSTPTPEGVRRHQPDGYCREAGKLVACTCKLTCPQPCKGECGCKACTTAFQDFGFDGMTEATRELHASLVRLCKGIISAWERWLSRQ